MTVITHGTGLRVVTASIPRDSEKITQMIRSVAKGEEYEYNGWVTLSPEECRSIVNNARHGGEDVYKATIIKPDVKVVIPEEE